MNYLIFDTETTGKWDFKSGEGDPHQPDLVQLGAVLVDEDFRMLGEMCFLVSDVQVPAEAQAIHGYSTETCETYGLPLCDVMGVFAELAAKADVIVAHNIDFDRRIISRSAFQMAMDGSPISGKPWFCTMKTMTPICKIPNQGRGGFKWPRLQELHWHLFQRGFSGAHSAMSDVQATMRCLKEIKARHPELLSAAA